MKDVFISHTTRDKHYAEQIVNSLESRGVSCFIAPRDIDAGKPYASALMNALDECKIVLLVASKSINESEHVLNEVDVIIEKKKILLPVFIEEFDLNDDFRYYLGRKQWIVCYPENLSVYLDNINSVVETYLPSKHSSIVSDDIENKKTKTIFEYLPDRGIMINPEDHQRNVSFRTDTLLNLMGGIYDNVIKLTDSNVAENIFYSSGYSSGKSFAERINNHWDSGYDYNSINNKVHKWCKFDSAVGWGNFSVNIYKEETEDNKIGTLSINEAILVDKSNKRKTCSFIKGYCTGVLDRLLENIDIELVCKSCPLNSRFKCVCEFDILVKG